MFSASYKTVILWFEIKVISIINVWYVTQKEIIKKLAATRGFVPSLISTSTFIIFSLLPSVNPEKVYVVIQNCSYNYSAPQITKLI